MAAFTLEIGMLGAQGPTSCNACFRTTGAHDLNADTTAFMQCLTSDLFKGLPTLKFLIRHGGGAVPYR